MLAYLNPLCLMIVMSFLSQLWTFSYSRASSEFTNFAVNKQKKNEEIIWYC